MELSGGHYLTGIERVLSVAKSDSRLQTIVNNHLFKMGYAQHLVGGYLFKETKIDSPAFCLGFQIFNYPVGLIFVGENFIETLTLDEIEFVVLHEMGHIMKNHFVANSFVWLAKSWIIDLIADVFDSSKERAKGYLELLKALYVVLSGGKRTIEEQTKAQLELDSDRYAVENQRRKEYAISTLDKLSHGNLRAPTHVTFDGNFPFPVITYEQRIEAIRRI